MLYYLTHQRKNYKNDIKYSNGEKALGMARCVEDTQLYIDEHEIVQFKTEETDLCTYV